jgi:hypothetical protein
MTRGHPAGHRIRQAIRCAIWELLEDEIVMNTEAALITEIGLAMLNSNDFATCNLERFSTKRAAFLAVMIRRFSHRFLVAGIRRVAEAEFDIGLEIIRLRES